MSKKKQVKIPPGHFASRAEHNPPPADNTKLWLLLWLITREKGATLAELESAAGRLAHASRAAITGLRKRGLDVLFERTDGVSRYVVGNSDR